MRINYEAFIDFILIVTGTYLIAIETTPILAVGIGFVAIAIKPHRTER